jgi:hypothetical protein
MNRDGHLDLSLSTFLSQINDEVWDEIGPRTDEHSRERVRAAVNDAIIAIVEAGQRSPELIFVYALSKAKDALV